MAASQQQIRRCKIILCAAQIRNVALRAGQKETAAPSPERRLFRLRIVLEALLDLNVPLPGRSRLRFRCQQEGRLLRRCRTGARMSNAKKGRASETKFTRRMTSTTRLATGALRWM